MAVLERLITSEMFLDDILNWKIHFGCEAALKFGLLSEQDS